METIITAATVLAMYFNAINSNDVNYMYNGDIEDGKVNKIEVYERNDNQQMEQKVEYCYEYDEEGRLTSKEMLSWDDAKKDWVKNSRLTYKYYKNEPLECRETAVRTASGGDALPYEGSQSDYSQNLQDERGTRQYVPDEQYAGDGASR